MPCAMSDAQNRRYSGVMISSSLLRACRSEPPGMYSITRPRYVSSVVMMPCTCTTRGFLSRTMMLNSVAKDAYIFMRSVTGTPTMLMHLMQTVSPPYSPSFTTPDPPRANESGST